MTTVVGSSLPPQVEGQLRCFLVVKVDILKWCIPRPPKDVQVKVLWWGDASKCVLLRPVVENDNDLDATYKCVEAHYPVRCGPKQFNAYLADMKSLLFDVVYGSTCSDFAKIEVPNIHQVTASKPIFGHYPLICSTVNLKRKQVGTLSITIAFKSISDAFNMASSIIPTTDEQFERMPAEHSKNSQKSLNSKSKGTICKTDLISVNRNKKTELEEQQQANYILPEIIDPIVTKKLIKVHQGSHQIKSSSGGITESIISSSPKTYKTPEVTNHSAAKTINSSPVKKLSAFTSPNIILNNEQGDNVLTSLLAKGQHLRDAMLKSSINTQLMNSKLINSQLTRCNEAQTFKNYNKVGIGLDQNLVEIMEKKTVDLVFGNEDEIGILLEQFSDHSVIESEEGDPLHDSSLLSDLFYTKKKDNKVDESSIVFSEDSGEETPIRTIKQQNKYIENKDEDLFCGRSNDNGSFGGSSDNDGDALLESNKMCLKKPKNIFCKENLGIDQITSLNKVKFAKVHVRELHLYQFHESSIYYVEFKFPVHTNCGMEVVRLVSSSKDGNCVNFDRCLELPVSFNGKTINYWLNSQIYFHLFAKYGNNKPDLFGNGSLSLKDVAINQNLATEFIINLFDKTSNSNKDKGISIGNLQITIELLPNVNNSSSYLQRPEKNQNLIDDEKEPGNISSEKLDKINELQNLIGIYDGSFNSDECFHWNLYCVCRVYWTNYEMKTKVIWGSCNPKFGFEKIVSIKAKSFHKTENNYLIVELWNKPLNQGKDKLVGICKVPLQTLFTVFKDCDLVDIFLKSQCPMIVCDSHMPVVDLITGKETGNLKLLIAVGLPKQISYLLHMQVSHLQMRPTDRKTDMQQSSNVLHEIEIAVEKLNIVFSDGRDAECYIKYYFPEQIFGDFKMSYFQIKPKLFISNSQADQHLFSFPHADRHIFSLPFNKQIQQCLLQCMNSTHKPTDIIFEIWRQSFDVYKSDQLVGKGTVEISRLFSLFCVSCGNSSMQHLNIPILPDKNYCKGSLELCIRYMFRQENLATVTKNTETETFLSISIMRLCGLKDAVTEVFKHHKDLDLYLENGVRTYVRCQLSFLPDSSFVESFIVAASHSPTFNFQYEVPLKSNNDSVLSFEISNGYLICQVLTKIDELKETILGKAKISLKQLLTHNTGVKGWYLFELFTGEKMVTGGVELHVRFLNFLDRGTLINNSMGRGWAPKFSVQHHDESWLISTDKRLCSFIISIGLLFFPIQVVNNILCEESLFYARYKFCDQGAIQSKFSRYKRCNESVLSEISHMHQFHLIPTPTLAWYLREESLEVEFWLSNRRLENNETDILIGSSYICLEQFSHDPYIIDTISGCYPLFRHGSKSICRSNCSITIHFNEDKSDFFRRTRTQTDNIYSDLFPDEFGEAKIPVYLNDGTKEMIEPIISKNTDTPTISIRIEEALHLPKIKQIKDAVSFIYVSYTISGKCVFTNVIPNNEKLIWKFQKDECLDLGSLKNHEFLFTIWRSINNEPNSEIDILLGTVYVDVSPLFSGMRELLGWYNVKDCNRQRSGQIKIGIVPSVLLSPSRSAKFFKNFNTTVSLDLTCSVNKKDPYYDSSLNKSELLSKLHMNLKELDCITRNIREFSLVNYVFKPQNSEIIKTENSCLNNYEHKIKQKLVEPLKHLAVNQDISQSVSFNVNRDVCQLMSLDINQDRQQIKNNSSCNFDEEEEKVDCDIEELSSDDDTDKLMNHLEEFKKKYNRLKEFTNLEFDQDWLSDDDQSITPIDYKEDILFVETETDDVINVSAKTSARDINEEDENSPGLIQNAFLVHSMENKCLQGLNKFCNPNDISCDDDKIDSISNSRKKSNHYIDQSGSRTNSSKPEKAKHEAADSLLFENNYLGGLNTIDGEGEIKNTHAVIPNFFMKSTEMAESIKALRLAAKFSHPLCSKNKAVKKIMTSDEKLNNEHSPVDDAELARRAEIFSSTNKQT